MPRVWVVARAGAMPMDWLSRWRENEGIAVPLESGAVLVDTQRIGIYLAAAFPHHIAALICALDLGVTVAHDFFLSVKGVTAGALCAVELRPEHREIDERTPTLPGFSMNIPTLSNSPRSRTSSGASGGG